MNESSPFLQGDHICVVYYTPEEQRAVAANYVAEGLRRGERAYYVADSQAAIERFRVALWAHGIDVPAALRTTALVEATFGEAHLVDGRFDSERMLRMLNEGIESALNDGFMGLRTCGDMSWLLSEPPGAEQVVEYEALLNQLFRSTRACGMCQYDASRLPNALLNHSLATHSTVVIDQEHKPNPFYSPAARGDADAHAEDLESKLRELRQR